MTNPNQTALYAAVEALLGVDDLAQWIKTRNNAGESYEAIARDIWKKTGDKVSVSLYTVRRWAENKESVA